MKKSLLMLITAAISLSMLSGCGGDNASEKETTEITTDSVDLYADESTINEFKTVFGELLTKFEDISAKVVSEDDMTLKPEYSEYQQDFDKILEEINILGSYVEEDGTNNEYFNKMTEKGRDILELLNNFVSKTGIN